MAKQTQKRRAQSPPRDLETGVLVLFIMDT